MRILYKIINNDNNKKALEAELSSKTIDVDRLYTLASQHVILPTLYNAINSKGLGEFFPNDFLKALSYVDSLNKERNQQILKQIHHISQLFNQYNIDYVFIKGTALLVKNSYRSISDRMIGDIDILVSKNNLEKANSLLINAGYKPTKYREKLYFIKHRHLPRLVSKQWICAVELHRKIIDKSESNLTPKKVFNEKEFYNTIPVTSTKHAIYTLILNSQVNDLNYYYWSLPYKTVYDFETLIKNKNYINNIVDVKNKYVRRFLLIKSLYYDDSMLKPTKIETLKIKFLKWRLKHSNFNTLYKYLIVKWNLLPLFPARFINLLINPPYLKSTLIKTHKFIKRNFFKTF